MATETINNKEFLDKEVDLVQILLFFWKARKFILIGVSLFLVLGLCKFMLTTSMYSGSITLYPAPSISAGGTTPMTAIARQLGISNQQESGSSFNIPDIVTSRTLAEQIVAHEWDINGFDTKVNLVTYFKKIKKVKMPEEIVTDEQIKAWNEARFYSYSKMMAQKRVTVSISETTSLITVTVNMEDPALARDIANFISQFVANWVNDSQKESIRQNLKFINGRVDILFTELQDAENELKKFRETNRNIINSPDLQLELQRLQRQLSIKQEVYLTLVKQKEINQIEENKSLDVVKILDKAIIEKVPYRPKIKITLILSAMLGLAISASIVTIIFVIEINLIKNNVKLPKWALFIQKIVFL